MAKAKMGANVIFGGHDGYFIADIHVVGNVNVVIGNGPINGDTILRNEEFGQPTHHIDDSSGYWNPQKGVFVVPLKSVREVNE